MVQLLISSLQLGERIARERKGVFLTQAALAGQLGLSRSTLVSIEKGERQPSSQELVAIARLLAIEVHDLISPTRSDARPSPRFRLPSGDPQSGDVAKVVAHLSELAGRYSELERLLEIERKPGRLEHFHAFRASEEDTAAKARIQAADAARSLRALLGLGEEPISGLEERLEADAGFRVFYLSGLPANLCAVLLWDDVRGAAVGLNRAHPEGRRRWSLAHELGHYLRDREAGDVLREDGSPMVASEAFADTFARDFLLPAEGVSRRFSERRRLNGGRFTAVDLYDLSRQFGVAFEAFCKRLEDLRLLAVGTFERLQKDRLGPGSIAPNAPDAPPPPALPSRYTLLAASAFDRGLLSEAELARFLEVERVEARRIYGELVTHVAAMAHLPAEDE